MLASFYSTAVNIKAMVLSLYVSRLSIQAIPIPKHLDIETLDSADNSTHHAAHPYDPDHGHSGNGNPSDP